MHARCTHAFTDKLLDLRKCDFKGGNLRAKVLAGALMSDADFSGADMQEAVLTKVRKRSRILPGGPLSSSPLHLPR
jgi:uncharacterized protein YjbI with pentapeptide repeats